MLSIGKEVRSDFYLARQTWEVRGVSPERFVQPLSPFALNNANGANKNRRDRRIDSTKPLHMNTLQGYAVSSGAYSQTAAGGQRGDRGPQGNGGQPADDVIDAEFKQTK